jgi:hydrogenase expression/formation protein HypC
MCIAQPGRLVAVWGDDTTRLGRVLVGDRVDEVNLSLIPEARPGDFIVIHSGIGVSVLDKAEADAALGLISGEDA